MKHGSRSSEIHLVLQQKWFKCKRDLSVGDLVFFKKTDSELGEGDWTIGLVEQVIPSKDKLIRQVVLKYRNAGEEFHRMTKRNPRKVVRLCNVEESDMSDDLSWVQNRLEQMQKTKNLPNIVRAGNNSHEGLLSKCTSCCCLSHCQVLFHSIGKKPLVHEMMDPFSLLGVEVHSFSCLYPDIDATLANLNVDGEEAVKVLEKEDCII